MRVISAILFYPRGGSSHVARALTRGLRARGCAVTLVSGSRTGLGGHGDARRFYGDVHAVDFDPALASPAPLRYQGPPGTAPMHPSFEDRPDAPDAVFASLDDATFELQVAAWARELERAGAAHADVAHLHHLTPLNEAIARVAPHVPVVGQVHGTELLMLERIDAGAPANWRYAERWAERLRGWAAGCARLLATPSGVDRAARVLRVPAEKLTPLASGVDLDSFSPRPIDRGAFWSRILVEHPQGWLPGQGAGSARYDRDAVRALSEAVVLLGVGRFTAVKRLHRLIEAFAQARTRARTPAALVLVGGHPGEWEGVHPGETARRLGVGEVYLAGWHDHESLPDFFAAADVIATTSAREQFGLVLVEAMACGVPVVATRSPGPEMIVEDGETGWLVGPDDEAALTGALVQAIDDRAERQRRGRAAVARTHRHFSWAAIAAELATILEDVVAERSAGPVPA